MMVGLPDAAVRESRERVRSALRNCGYDIPPTHITVNLAPADIKKEGSGFDLPMAMGILGAYGGLAKQDVTDYMMVGELSLDGGVRAVRGGTAHRGRGPRPEDHQVDRSGRQCQGSSRRYRHKCLPCPHDDGSDPVAEHRQWYRANDGRSRRAAERSTAVHRGLQGSARSAHRQARARSRLRWRTQSADDRPSRLGQNHAGQAYAYHHAAACFRGSAGDDEDPLGCRRSRRWGRTRGRPTLQSAAPHDFRRRTYWRRRRAASGRGIARPQRGAVPRRAAGISAQCSRSHASAS